LDHPNVVDRLAVFDVILIFEAWARAYARFAQTFWSWALLSQKEPLPESYLLDAPEAAFHNPFGQGSFGPEILDEYVSTFRDPARVHGSVRNIEPRQRSMSNMIAPTRKQASESIVRCYICGPSGGRPTRSTEKTVVHWAFGGNGLRARKDRP
jgi:hypothetical protein